MKSQNLGERKRTSSIVRAGIKYRSSGTDTVRFDSRTIFFLIALARSYERFVLSVMKKPLDNRVNKANWTSSCVDPILEEW